MAVSLQQSSEYEPAQAAEIVVHPPRRLTVGELLHELRLARHLFRVLTITAVQRFLRSTFLGPLWLGIHVFMNIASKAFIFGAVLSVKTPRDMPYGLFLMTGMLGWQLFQDTISYGLRSYQRNRRYFNEFYFPLAIVGIAGSGQALIEFFLYLTCMIAGFAWYWHTSGIFYLEIGPNLLLAAYGIVLCFLFSWGLSLVLGPLNYRARDVRHVLKYVIGFWLYLTPVVYPLENLHGVTLVLAKANPMAPIVQMIKYGLIGYGAIGVRFVVYGTVVSIGTFLFGLWFVNRFGHTLVAGETNMDMDDDL
jgi:lipopolysaccharide transport system permease protein